MYVYTCIHVKYVYIYIHIYMDRYKKKLPAGRATYNHGLPSTETSRSFRVTDFSAMAKPPSKEDHFWMLCHPFKVVFIQAIHCCSLYGHPSIFVNGITYLSAGYRISSISSTQRRFGDSGPFPWDLTHWDILLTIILWKGIAIQSKNDDPTRIIHGSDRN